MGRLLPLKKGHRALVGILLLAAIFFAWEQAGQSLPHMLLERAWTKSVTNGEAHRPWPWLESAPVARLFFPTYSKDFVIMAGTEGDILSLAPGWNEGTAPPGTAGISLISAHRALHFNFLPQMKPGEEIVLEDLRGRTHRYRVDEIRIVQEPEIRVPVEQDYGTLLLSTSFPIVNWTPARELNLVVVATEKPMLTASETVKDLPGA